MPFYKPVMVNFYVNLAGHSAQVLVKHYSGYICERVLDEMNMYIYGL